MIKAYLFDFDGTLVDSMPTFVNSMLRILDESGIKYDENIIKIITPLGVAGTANYYKELGVKGSTEDIIMKMEDENFDPFNR
jgi:beta-phosphoglucomutase-like phosphatase (HAD superfamily)